MRSHVVAFIAAVAIAAASSTALAGQDAADLLSSGEAQALAATATTPAQHQRLARHYRALAVKYEADATSHATLVAAYRKQPSASETKRPGSPDTAAHCDRFAKLAAKAAKEARALAFAHDQAAQR